MARWISNRITQDANSAGGIGGYGKTGEDEAACVVLDEDPEGRRLGVFIQVPDGATHAVRLAIGLLPASDRNATVTLPPGGQFDTTQLPAVLQPKGQITAWTGPDLDAAGAGAAGVITLDVTEILPD